MAELRKDGSMSDENENENENEEYVKLEFPLEYPACAVCGCRDTIAQTIANGLIADERASKNLKAWLQATKSIIVDTTRPWLTAPMLATIICACAQCGTLRVTGAATQMIMAGTEPHQAGPPSRQ